MQRPIDVTLVMGALLFACGAAASAASPGPIASFTHVDPSAARSVCEEKGGTVEVREAIFGTNGDPPTWVDLGRSVEMCRFVDEGGNSIFVDTLTLASPGPTLASVAYLSAIPMGRYDPSRGNPSDAYCVDLAASSAFGPGASGGGWVDTASPGDPNAVADMCVFPDGSMVDAWGLAYHGSGTIRGADLATMFVYQPTDGLPPIFPH